MDSQRGRILPRIASGRWGCQGEGNFGGKELHSSTTAPLDRGVLENGNFEGLSPILADGTSGVAASAHLRVASRSTDSSLSHLLLILGDLSVDIG